MRVPVLMLTAILERSGATCVKLEEPPTGLWIGRLLERRPATDVCWRPRRLLRVDELRRGVVGTMTGFAFSRDSCLRVPAHVLDR